MRRILILLATIALTIGGTVAAAPANAATCATVWLTAPTYFGKIQAGAKRCIWPHDTANGWIRLYQFDDRTRPVVDWVDPYSYTHIRPNSGLYQPNADRARALAKKYHVRLQFAVKDLHGRTGCQDAHIGQISGSYMPSGRYPGKGLVRMGTGYTSTCMRDWREVRETTLHELAHARIEYRCGAWTAGMSTAAAEKTTDAYAYRYMGAWTKNPGGYGFSDWHWRKAARIAQNDC